MAFSWEKAIERAHRGKIERCKTCALTKDPEYVLAHPDEAKEFMTHGKSLTAIKRIDKDFEKRHNNQVPTKFPIVKRMNRQ